MPRHPDGNCVEFTPGNPVVTNTTIASNWWNNTYTDILSMLTYSLDRNGNGGMLAAFTLVDGTVSVPAFAFQSETTTGFYKAATGDMRVSVQGNDVFKWTPTAVACLQPLTVTGGITSTGGSPNGRGGTFNGVGTEQGVVGTGGSSGGSGTWGIAGTAAGYGAIGQGVSGGVGAYAYSSATNVDVLRADGYVDISHASTPAIGAAFTNHVTPKNVCKVWVVARTDGAGNITASDGFNVGSISISGATVTLGFGTNFSTTNYSVVGNAGLSSSGQPVVIQNTRSVGSCSFKLLDATSGLLYNLSTTAMDITVQIYGGQ